MTTNETPKPAQTGIYHKRELSVTIDESAAITDYLAILRGELVPDEIVVNEIRPGCYEAIGLDIDDVSLLIGVRGKSENITIKNNTGGIVVTL